ncbi:MAG: MBL fold metallo-hydrolase [Anaerolineae bacterium]|nr:MBL fold metallo-hydrolase [Anaerolineae bacterium]
MPSGKDLITHIQTTPIIPNSLGIWGLGQLGMAIKGPDGVIYIDPCLSDVVRNQFGDFWVRAYDPPLLPEDVTNADFCFISHEHLDHLDPETVGPLAKASPQSRFVTTAWCRDLLNDLDIGDDRHIFPEALQSTTLPRTSLRVTVVPSAHYEKEYDEAKGYRWIGFLIEWNGVTLYHAGDTIIYPGYIDILQSLPRPDVVVLPVNGRDWYRDVQIGATGNLLPYEAAWLCKEFGWDTFIPAHNDLYPGNRIPNEHIFEAFDRVAPRQKVKQLQPGELYYYVK